MSDHTGGSVVGNNYHRRSFHSLLPVACHLYNLFLTLFRCYQSVGHADVLARFLIPLRYVVGTLIAPSFKREYTTKEMSKPAAMASPEILRINQYQLFGEAIYIGQ